MDKDIEYAILYMATLAVVMIAAVVAMASGVIWLGVILILVLLGLFSVPFVIFGKAYNRYRRH